MKVTSDPSDSPTNPFTEVFRLQTEFQTRLAEETLRYLRKFQGALAPSAPGTVMLADEALELLGSGHPGSRVALSLEIENRQRVHTVVTPLLSPLVDASGTTWFPQADATPVSSLLAPDESRSVRVEVALPDELPRGKYRGALILQGFRNAGIPVTITVTPKRKRQASAKKTTRAGGRRKS
jgi:hypothetical protein